MKSCGKVALLLPVCPCVASFINGLTPAAHSDVDRPAAEGHYVLVRNSATGDGFGVAAATREAPRQGVRERSVLSSFARRRRKMLHY